MSDARTKKRGSAPKKARKRRSNAKRAGKSGARALKPVKMPKHRAAGGKRDEGGPLGWFAPMMESAHASLSPRNETVTAVPSTARPAAAVIPSSLQPGRKATLAAIRPTDWRELLREYRRRKALAVPVPVPVPLRAGVAPAAPFVPGGRNWLPLGPAVVLNGQTVGNQPVAGRVSGLAIAPGGQIVYAASANGGVFRSDDGGTSWRSLMDGFDLDPTDFASASLACGAIAIDPTDPSRVYVGTGEGDTNQMFRARILSALPAYRGVGPIRSDNGGVNWVPEPSAPDLAGEAFFALAVDPRNRDNVIGATTKGLYQRVPKAGGQFEWVSRRPGVHSSVVVASAGNTTWFFAAEWGKGVFRSSDGETWKATDTAFPADGVGRIELGVQPNNPGLVYAFVAKEAGSVHGLYRLDGVTASWKRVDGAPNVLLGSQGDYDLTIAVDPVDGNLVYLGGDRTNSSPYPANVQRCVVQAAGAGYKAKNPASIGTHAHADVHILVHTPGDPTELWLGCDGGVFLNRNPRGTGEFGSQNNGLSCLCCNFIAQHPTDPSILFTGLQDNGTARTSGSPQWSHILGGDGGYCLINWARPALVLAFANGERSYDVYRSTTGAETPTSWETTTSFPWATMTLPMVSAPYNPATPADAELVAVGAGPNVYLSPDFAESWPTGMRVALPNGSGSVFALAFASTTRLFIATTTGQVFRADRAGDAWTANRVDNVPAGSLGLNGLISDIAVDWSDATLSSVYVAFGGRGDRRHVWRFDGTRWQARSGPEGGNGLLDVEHNALAVDRTAPNNVYVGADIGVWHSQDRGMNWVPMENGLPDAPVYDLQVHATQRLLRAATHGRGVYEIPLS